MAQPVVVDAYGDAFYYAVPGNYTEVYVYPNNGVITDVLIDQPVCGPFAFIGGGQVLLNPGVGVVQTISTGSLVVSGSATDGNLSVTGTFADSTGAVGTNGQFLSSTVTGTLWINSPNAVSSVFGRTGVVVAVSGDYTVAQVTGAAPLASPTFTGVPAAPTATLGTNTTQLATTAFVQAAIPTTMAFSAITAGTNTVALVVGTGGSLTVSGTGTINSTSVGGITVTGTPTAGQQIIATSSSAASWQSRTFAIQYVIDGGGALITTGAKGQIDLPFNATLTGWVLTADQAGSAVVDVLRSTYAGFPTTSSIASSDKPTLSAVQKNENLAVSVWTTALSAGDQIQFNVNSVTTCTRLNLTLICTRP
jgi:hypothetical protein